MPSGRILLTVAVAVSIAASVDLRSNAGDAAPTDDQSFTLALAGDSLITRKLSVVQNSSFNRVADLIRGADAAFTNLEMLLHDFEPYPMNESGGTWMRGDPVVAKELAWLGFDMVSRANNHAGDYGVEGMRLTTKYVSEAGLVQAGVGENLDEAREARFLETPKGRVGLVSVSSTFPDHARAGKARAGIRGRPGLNPLRFTTTYQLPADRLQALREIGRELRLDATAQNGSPGSPPSDSLRFLNGRFVAADRPAIHTEPLAEDIEEIASVVRNSSRMADRTIVTIHAHEGSPGDRARPAEFLVTFAHAMIDAGADIVAGHGPHIVRGVEIYKGKPILYSLGDFVFENDLVNRLPADAYQQEKLGPLAGVADFDDARSDHDRRSYPADREMWESFVALAEWHGKTLTGLTLHPLTLGFGKSRTERGRPMMADGPLASKILDDVVQRSKPYDTQIVVADGVGRVTLSRRPGQ